MSRVFDTAWCDSKNPPDVPYDTTSYDTNNQLTYVDRMEYVYARGKQRRTQWDTICVSVDGACSNNGFPDARSASAVYFGPGSVYNWADVLDPNGGHRQTNNYADVFAVIRALRIFQKNRSEGYCGWNDVNTIVVVTNSDYVFKAMVDYIYKWDMNGYTNSRGGIVVNWEVFRKLHGLVQDVENEGIRVFFWKVPRQYNEEADALARSKLY